MVEISRILTFSLRFFLLVNLPAFKYIRDLHLKIRILVNSSDTSSLKDIEEVYLNYIII